MDRRTRQHKSAKDRWEENLHRQEAETTICPVPLALKHLPTLPKDYPSEPVHFKQEEHPR